MRRTPATREALAYHSVLNLSTRLAGSSLHTTVQIHHPRTWQTVIVSIIVAVHLFGWASVSHDESPAQARSWMLGFRIRKVRQHQVPSRSHPDQGRFAMYLSQVHGGFAPWSSSVFTPRVDLSVTLMIWNENPCKYMGVQLGRRTVKLIVSQGQRKRLWLMSWPAYLKARSRSWWVGGWMDGISKLHKVDFLLYQSCYCCQSFPPIFFLVHETHLRNVLQWRPHIVIHRLASQCDCFPIVLNCLPKTRMYTDTW